MELPQEVVAGYLAPVHVVVEVDDGEVVVADQQLRCREKVPGIVYLFVLHDYSATKLSKY